MHILLVVSWYKTPENRIAGSFFEEQARMLHKAGYQVGIFFPEIDMQFKMRFKKGKRQPSDFIDKGIPTLYSFCKSIVPRSKTINFRYVSLIAEKKVGKYIKEHGKPDIIHAHSTYYAGVVTAHIARRFKIPFVLTEHFSGLLTSNEWKMPACVYEMRKVFSQSRANIVVSTFFKEQLVEKYALNGNSITVIPNLVNPMFFSAKAIVVHRPFSFCVIGSLISVKRHDLLLKAFQLVCKEEECILHIAGDGQLRDGLKKLVRDLSIEKNVVFHGALSRNQVLQILNDSHALVSSSLFETFGVNIIEALAAGRPVVSTDSGGPRDIINPTNGILVEDPSEENLAKAMLVMIRNYSKYNSKEISEDCRDRFSENVIVSRLREVYAI